MPMRSDKSRNWKMKHPKKNSIILIIIIINRDEMDDSIRNITYLNMNKGEFFIKRSDKNHITNLVKFTERNPAKYCAPPQKKL